MEAKEDLVLKRVKEVIEHGVKAIGQQSFIYRSGVMRGTGRPLPLGRG